MIGYDHACYCAQVALYRLQESRVQRTTVWEGKEKLLGGNKEKLVAIFLKLACWNNRNCCFAQCLSFLSLWEHRVGFNSVFSLHRVKFPFLSTDRECLRWFRRSRDGVVGYRLDDSRFNSLHGEGIFSSMRQTCSGAHPRLIFSGYRVIFLLGYRAWSSANFIWCQG